ncbi:MAG: chemotaxis protein CheD [Magnetococcales bacterium]|nr:chemotaxis protein CheD [Magnetococcales bacterium]
MKSPDFRGLPSLYLEPNQLIHVDKPTVISTILGSCVALTVHHPKTCFGVMCHCLLSRCPMKKNQQQNDENSTTTCEQECFRFVECTVPHILEMCASRGYTLESLNFKLFGGSELFTNRGFGPDESASSPSVGSANVSLMKTLLKQHGIKLKACNVGGMEGRKIFFYTDTGEVLMRKINNTRQTGHLCRINSQHQ